MMVSLSVGQNYLASGQKPAAKWQDHRHATMLFLQ
jgi:hypothetical protein